MSFPSNFGQSAIENSSANIYSNEDIDYGALGRLIIEADMHLKIGFDVLDDRVISEEEILNVIVSSDSEREARDSIKNLAVFRYKERLPVFEAATSGLQAKLFSYAKILEEKICLFSSQRQKMPEHLGDPSKKLDGLTFFKIGLYLMAWIAVAAIGAALSLEYLTEGIAMTGVSSDIAILSIALLVISFVSVGGAALKISSNLPFNVEVKLKNFLQCVSALALLLTIFTLSKEMSHRADDNPSGINWLQIRFLTYSVFELSISFLLADKLKQLTTLGKENPAYLAISNKIHDFTEAKSTLMSYVHMLNAFFDRDAQMGKLASSIQKHESDIATRMRRAKEEKELFEQFYNLRMQGVRGSY